MHQYCAVAAGSVQATTAQYWCMRVYADDLMSVHARVHDDDAQLGGEAAMSMTTAKPQILEPQTPLGSCRRAPFSITPLIYPVPLNPRGCTV